MADAVPRDIRTGGTGAWRALVDILNHRRLLPVLLISPVLVFFIVWNVIPIVWLAGLSFYNYSLISQVPPDFIGFDNFERVLNSGEIWRDVSRTFFFVVIGVSIQTVLGVLLGLLFWDSSDMPGRRVALTLLFAPMILTPIAAGTFFRLMYDPTFGVINAIVMTFGFAPIDFLGSPSLAFPAVLAVDTWMWTPFMVLMTLAALGSVPKAELEAAEVDRLPWLTRMRLIVLYHGKFILMLGIILRTIESFKTMDLPFQMTHGGPGSRTQLMAISLYRQAFESFQMGYSSALAVISLFISIAFTAMFIYVLKLRRESSST